MCYSVRKGKVCLATVLFSITGNTVPGKSVFLLQDSLAPKHWGNKSRSIFLGSLWHLQISWCRLNIMMSSYQCNDSRYKCNTIPRPSYLYNGHSLYWDMPRIHKGWGVYLKCESEIDCFQLTFSQRSVFVDWYYRYFSVWRTLSSISTQLHLEGFWYWNIWSWDTRIYSLYAC